MVMLPGDSTQSNSNVDVKSCKSNSFVVQTIKRNNLRWYGHAYIMEAENLTFQKIFLNGAQKRDKRGTAQE